MDIMFDIFVFIVPVILGFFEILFYRKCVVSPKIPRISWVGFILLCIPVFGAIIAYTLLIFTVVFCVSEDIELDEKRKFVQKWLKS